MRTLTRRVAALAIVSTLTLAGCGSSDSSDGGSDSSDSNDSSATKDSSDEPTAAPATGDVISGTGFEFNAPEGWTDAKDVLPSALAVAANRSDTDGFSDNINIIEDKTIVDVDTDKLEDAVEKVLKGVNAQDVTIKDPTDVDGEEAVRVQAVLEQNGTKYRTDQYAVDHDGKGYVITLSYSEDLAEADRDKVSASVLASWKWS